MIKVSPPELLNGQELPGGWQAKDFQQGMHEPCPYSLQHEGVHKELPIVAPA